MNKGSATKWAEALETGKYVMNDGIGLRYADNTFCVAGVLEDFASGGSSWKLSALECVYETMDGSPHVISKDIKSRCKIKTDFAEVYDFHRQNAEQSPAFFAAWIMENYERF
jgi:hypothetical protein